MPSTEERAAFLARRRGLPTEHEEVALPFIPLTLGHRLSRVFTVPFLVAFFFLVIQLVMTMQYVQQATHQLVPTMQRSCIGVEGALDVLNATPAIVANATNALAVSTTNKMIDTTIGAVTGAITILGSIVRLLIQFLLGSWRCLAQAALTTIAGLVEVVVNNALTIAQSIVDAFDQVLEWIWDFEEKVRNFVENLIGVTWATPDRVNIPSLDLGTKWASGISQIAVGSVDAWIAYATSYLQGFLDDAAEDVQVALTSRKLGPDALSLLDAPTPSASGSFCTTRVAWSEVNTNIDGLLRDLWAVVIVTLVFLLLGIIGWLWFQEWRLHRSVTRREMRVAALVHHLVQSTPDKRAERWRHLHHAKQQDKALLSSSSLNRAESTLQLIHLQEPTEHQQMTADGNNIEPNQTAALQEGQSVAEETILQVHATYNLPLWLARWTAHRDKDVLFLVHYCWHPPSFACIALGLSGVVITSVFIALLIACKTAFFEHVAPAVAQSLVAAQVDTTSIFSRNSAWFADQINAQLNSTSAAVNEDLLTPIADVATTVRVHFTATQEHLMDDITQWTNSNANVIFFGQTFIPDLINGLYSCLIGSKVQLFEEALTILGSFQLDLALLSQDQLVPSQLLVQLGLLVQRFNVDMLGQTSVIASPMLTSSSTADASISTSRTSSEGGYVGHVFDEAIAVLETARVANLCILLLGFIVALQGLLLFTWRRRRRILAFIRTMRQQRQESVALKEIDFAHLQAAVKTVRGSEVLQRSGVIDLAAPPLYTVAEGTRNDTRQGKQDKLDKRANSDNGLDAEKSEVAGKARPIRVKPIEDERLRSILSSYHQSTPTK